MPWSVQFKLEVEEVDDAAPDLAKYRHGVSQPLIIQVRCSLSPDAAEVCPDVSAAELHRCFMPVRNTFMPADPPAA